MEHPIQGISEGAAAAVDDWGPALPMPGSTSKQAKSQEPASAKQPTPAATIAVDASTSTPAAKPAVGLFNKTFDQDPVYMAALQQATENCKLLPTPLHPYQFSTTSNGTAGRSVTQTTGSTATASPQPETNAKATSLPEPTQQPSSKTSSQFQNNADSLRDGIARMQLQEPPKQQTPSRGTPGSSKPAARSVSTPAVSSLGQATIPKPAERKGSMPALAQKGMQYEDHMPQEHLQRLVKTGAAFSGKLRINPSDRTEAYITVNGLPHDILIKGALNQNRACDGDEVVVQVLPVALWYKQYKFMSQDLQDRLNRSKEFLEKGGVASKKSGAPQPEDRFLLTPWAESGGPEQSKSSINECLKIAPTGALRVTGRVVGITKPSPRREQLVGVLQSRVSTRGTTDLYLLPLDPSFPRCQVLSSNIPHLSKELVEEASTPLEGQGAHRTLVSARVVKWDTTSEQPEVEIRNSLGQAGEIESETAAILHLYGVRNEEFTKEVLACLPPTPWTMSAQDMAGRRDFRSHRVFSIDPPTARDLDDAMHIQPVPGRPGHWHVGVHIADVGHFIPPYSALDYEAGLRSTSVYLVQKVIPMLPRLLCEELCSLNPGVDRFAFSIEWELDEQGEVVAQWAGRSIIRSRAKLAYPMVQAMIDGNFKPEECTASLHDNASWDQVVADCLHLHKLAQHRRGRRFNELGALRLDGVRLTFGLDKDGNPMTVGQYKGAEANQLIEEFMLLANMRVAQLIAGGLPDRAMLRCHPPPNPRKMEALQALSDEQHLALDCSSAAALQATLAAFKETCEDRQLVELVTMMATRPMQLAQYFCTGEQPDQEQWRHYALAVPEYTHFTSPIRRYPDVVVHRLLAALLDMQPSLTFAAPDYYAAGQPGALIPGQLKGSVSDGTTEPSKDVIVQGHKLFSTDLTGKVAEHCNEKRLASRNAQDMSLRLYLCVMLRRHPVVTQGVVSQLGGDRHFAVYLPMYGIEIRIQVEDHAPIMGANYHAPSKTIILNMEPQLGFGNGNTPNRGASRTASGQQLNRAGSSKAVLNGGNGNGGEEGNKTLKTYASWMSDLPDLTIQRGLQPVQLPLKLKMFDTVPVVITSPLKLGGISVVEGRVLLDPTQLLIAQASPQEQQAMEAVQAKVAAAMAAKEALVAAEQGQAATATPAAVPQPTPAETALPEEVVVQTPDKFCIPYETMLND